ncbi:GNAT family N-acetyltransferase [Caulobacter sp. S45]|uniref:GNAT family N-acetyltransferase n=1 Tax=Caulobacter sp. S45 TaxID=1641861 RepID=UPI00157540F3|nr:GNAT family N-acetyltransferase [Caulobacter sp. S45]
MNPPVLASKRLVLRAHAHDDLPDFAAMWADPQVVRHIGGRPFTAEEVWTRLLRAAGMWVLLGYGYWVVRERDGGAFVGELGFADFRRELDPPFGDAPEAGWALASAMHGRGYAGEALAAAHAWADAALRRRTVCMITPANLASIAVARRCGYRPYAETLYKGAATTLFERPAPA